MSAWLAWLKDILRQLAADRAEMLAGRDIEDKQKEGEGPQPIPFWLWHMF